MEGGGTYTNSWNCLIRKSSIISSFFFGWWWWRLWVTYRDDGVIGGRVSFDFFSNTALMLADKIEIHRRGYCIVYDERSCACRAHLIAHTRDEEYKHNFTPPKGRIQEEQEEEETDTEPVTNTHTREREIRVQHRRLSLYLCYYWRTLKSQTQQTIPFGICIVEEGYKNRAGQYNPRYSFLMRMDRLSFIQTTNNNNIVYS